MSFQSIGLMRSMLTATSFTLFRIAAIFEGDSCSYCVISSLSIRLYSEKEP
jgi:hypothetical protein